MHTSASAMRLPGLYTSDMQPPGKTIEPLIILMMSYNADAKSMPNAKDDRSSRTEHRYPTETKAEKTTVSLRQEKILSILKILICTKKQREGFCAASEETVVFLRLNLI